MTQRHGKTRRQATTRYKDETIQHRDDVVVNAHVHLHHRTIYESIWIMSRAQTIWIERCMGWFGLALPASVPAPMKIMWMNFGFAGFLWCKACAMLMPFNWFRLKESRMWERNERFQFYTVIKGQSILRKLRIEIYELYMYGSSVSKLCLCHESIQAECIYDPDHMISSFISNR